MSRGGSVPGPRSSTRSTRSAASRAPGSRSASMLPRMTRAVRPSDSTSSTSGAPRDSASRPTAPEPAYRSSTRASARGPHIDKMVPNSPSRARSDVGRVPRPAGTDSRLPPAVPAMMRVTGGSGLLEILGLLPVEQHADRGGQRGLPGQRRVGRDQVRGLAAGLADQLLVGEQGEQLQARPAAGLGGAEHVALPALLEIEPG